jgi:molybdopterin converting factor small subunit
MKYIGGREAAPHRHCFFEFAFEAVLSYNDIVQVRVHFYSYFKELAGSSEVTETVASGSRLEVLLQQIFLRFPRLAAMRKSVMVAVGVDYQGGDYIVAEGDEVSLFPPVQGG